MRLILNPAMVVTIALILGACATQSTQGEDPMPPIPASVAEQKSRGFPCGPPSQMSRPVDSEGGRLIREGRRGWVMLRVTVGTSGAVTHTEVIASAPPGLFDAAAQRMAESDRFPARESECTWVYETVMGGDAHE